MDETTLNPSICDRLKEQDRKPKWAVPFPEVAFWINTARTGGRKTAARTAAAADPHSVSNRNSCVLSPFLEPQKLSH